MKKKKITLSIFHLEINLRSLHRLLTPPSTASSLLRPLRSLFPFLFVGMDDLLTPDNLLFDLKPEPDRGSRSSSTTLTTAAVLRIVTSSRSTSCLTGDELVFRPSSSALFLQDVEGPNTYDFHNMWIFRNSNNVLSFDGEINFFFFFAF